MRERYKMAKGGHSSKHRAQLPWRTVKELRQRFAEGDLKGKGMKSVAHAYRIAPSEAARALGGLTSYSKYPDDYKVTDIRLLQNAIPQTIMDSKRRPMFMHIDEEEEAALIEKAESIMQQKEMEEMAVTNYGGEETRVTNPDRSWDRRAKQYPDGLIRQVRELRASGSSVDDITKHFPQLAFGSVRRMVNGEGRWSHLGRVEPGSGKLPEDYPGYPVDEEEVIENAAVTPVPHEAAPTPQPQYTAPIPTPTPTPVPAPTSPQLSTAEQLIRTMLSTIDPVTLGWMRMPNTSRPITEILKDVKEAHEMFGMAMQELTEWAEAFENQQKNVEVGV